MSVAEMKTYDMVGIKEDVSDIITNISPTKTPFQAQIGSRGVTQTLYQWQEDSLNAVGVNAQVEGANAITAVQNPTVMRSNVTQILEKTASVSGTADAVKSHGRARELAYQLSLRSAEIKRDLEFAFVGAKQAAVTGDDSTARKTASAFAMINPSVTYNMDSGNTNKGFGTDPSTYKTGGTAAAIDEATVLAVAQALYTGGADPDTLMIKPGDSLNVSAFQANGRTRYVDNGDKSVVNVVDFYQSPFGRLKVVMNRFILSSAALVYEGAMWKKATLRNWFRETLAKTGDSTQVMLVGEFGLMHRNFGASGAITNLA